jgi:single-strand DNA-binding protein
MTINLNRVTITGYLAREPELIDLPAGQQACKLRIACNRRRQHQLTGTWQEWADFFDARIPGALAPIAHRRLRTGHVIAIDGRLSNQRSGCNDPAHRLATVIIAEEIQFLTKPTDAHPTTPIPGTPHQQAPPHPGDMLVTDEDEPGAPPGT